MRYYYSLFVDVIKRNLIKFLVIEFLIILLFLFFRNECNLLNFVFGMHLLDFSDVILMLGRLINTCIIIYITYNFYLCDMYNSPELLILRRNAKKCFIDKIICIILFILFIKFLYSIVLILFGFNYDFSILINCIFNVIYLVLLSIGIVNSFSNNSYFFAVVFVLLFGFNLFYITDFVLLKVCLCVIIFCYDYLTFNYHKIYDSFI